MNGRNSDSPRVLLVPAEDAWQGAQPTAGAIELVLARPWLILATAALFALLAAAITPLLTPIYRAEALVSVASDAEGGLKGISSSGQIGALASLAGVDLADPKKGEYIAHLRSKVTVRQLIREDNLLPVLFRSRWDAAANDWKKTFFHPRVPSIDDGTRRFTEDVMSVSEDRKSGLVTLGVEWSDPVLAAKWANRLVDIANARLRESAITENARRTDFLQRELDKTSAVETRQVIYRLQEQTLNRIMVANTQPQYALRIVDPAEPPDLYHPNSPKLVAMITGGLFIGALAGAMIALFLGRRRSSAAANPPAS